MLVLRYKYHGERGWKVPLNLRIGKTEIPLGLFSVFLVLLTTAIVNLLTKSVATVSGILFAAAFFVIFSLSERDNKRRHVLATQQMREHFQLEHQDTIGRQSLDIRPGAVVVTMRDSAAPFALKWVPASSVISDSMPSKPTTSPVLTGFGAVNCGLRLTPLRHGTPGYSRF